MKTVIMEYRKEVVVRKKISILDTQYQAIISKDFDIADKIFYLHENFYAKSDEDYIDNSFKIRDEDGIIISQY